jgi:co-chaperonin GroES (HSP10)
MGIQLNVVKGTVKAVGNRVLVSDMYFGEQVTKGGIVITSDDGKSRGIYPRWAKVYCKGPQNKDPYEIGQWILVEHGRWTRSFKVEDSDSEKELRMVEAESILAYADERPNETFIGEEFSNGSSIDIKPEDFIR